MSVDARIEVRPLGDGRFAVTVDEHGSKSRHEVTVSQAQASSLCGDCECEDLVAASMQFLLEREPKESIMGRFDLDVIPRYFPDFADVIREYL